MRTDPTVVPAPAQMKLHQWIARQTADFGAPEFTGHALADLLVEARAHGVLALLGHWPQTQAALLAHTEHAQTARVEHARTAMVDALHRMTLLELGDAFAIAAIPGLVIKGAALALSHYPSPGLRPRVDTDLLIEPAQQARAHQILLNAQWQPLASNFSALVLPERTYQKRISGALISLDLHWALSSRPLLARALPFAILNKTSVAFDRSTHWRMPCAVDALLIAALHRIGHHRDQERFIWLYDMHLLWQAMTLCEQDQTLSRAAQLGLSAILLDALLPSQALFHAEIADAQLARLRGVKNEPGATLLQNKLSDFAFDWRFASWHERYALIQQRIWANPEYLRSQFDAKHAPIGWLQMRRWLNR